MTGPAPSDLASRLRVAVIGIPAGFLVVWLGGWPLAIVLAVIGMLGVREALALGEARGLRPFSFIAISLGIAPLLLAPLAMAPDGVWAEWMLGLVMGGFFLALGLAVFVRRLDDSPLASVALTVAAPLYVALPLAFAWFLRHHPLASVETPGWAGTGFLLLAVITTWMGDTTAYFGGRAVGRRKLLPRVSPAKTVEGAISGLAGSIGVAVLLTQLIFPLLGGGESIAWSRAILMGGLIGMVAQIGDLAESVLKREAGVKDSGTLLPGHGGVLDRFDALLFTLPLTWFLIAVLAGGGQS